VGQMGGQRFGQEMLNRMPQQSLYNMAGQAQNSLSNFFRNKLPPQYQGYGQTFANGLGALGKGFLDRSGMGAKNLPEIFGGLPGMAGNLGRQAGGMLSKALQPHMSRDMRSKTVGDLPGMAAGHLGSMAEDKVFGQKTAPQHALPQHGSSGEYEGMSNMYPEEHAYGGHIEPHFAYGGHTFDGGNCFGHNEGHEEPHFAGGGWGIHPLSSGDQQSMSNGLHSAGDWMKSHLHFANGGHMMPMYAHGGHSLRDLAEILDTAQSMGHYGEH
jgi:hypothetical protein